MEDEGTLLDEYRLKEILTRHECYTDGLLRALNTSLDTSVRRYLKEDDKRYKSFSTEAVSCLQSSLIYTEGKDKADLEERIENIIEAYNKVIKRGGQ